MLDYIGLSIVKAHDFRATASKSLIEKLLAYADGNNTRATYNPVKHLEARRKMLQAWVDIIDRWAN